MNFRFLSIFNKKELLVLIKNRPTLLKYINRIFQIVNHYWYNSVVENRRYSEFTDLSRLSGYIPYYPLLLNNDSNFYGVAYSLKTYSGLKSLEITLEHGVYLGNYVPYSSFLSCTQAIVTFSDQRRKYLMRRGLDKPIISIGPYICYTSGILNELDFKKLKEKYGRTLLVFPSHSIRNYHVSHDLEEFIESIVALKDEFETVMVCLYYEDARKKYLVERYFAEGFICVTAGHKRDKYFLSRLRDIIELSDYTVSNSVGTHTGYCISLDKPHEIIPQRIEHLDNKGRLSKKYRTDAEYLSLIKERDHIENAFLGRQSAITKKQRLLIDKYWGLDLLKDRDTLKSLFSEL